MKIHERRKEVLVAVCDEDLVGEVISDGEFSLTIRESFYGSESFCEERVLEALKGASICNLVGEQSVGVGIKEGFIRDDMVLEVDGVPHAQMVTFSGSK
ncbi:DUF424 domain-containing protein [archaeon SCG-AAA382B04]|nr:DUF424 domain-containing protein [archaeon SCG-AAA382B04]